jgi:hypothetical protein
MTEQNTTERKPWSRTVIAVVTVLTAGVAGIAAFSANILSIRENVEKLFHREPFKIAVREASANEEPSIGMIHVQFVLAREGNPNLVGTLSCEGEGLDPKGLDRGVYFSGKSNFSDSISETGDLAMSIYLMPPVFGLAAPERLNFRVNCAGVFTPWVPIKVAKKND